MRGPIYRTAHYYSGHNLNVKTAFRIIRIIISQINFYCHRVVYFALKRSRAYPYDSMDITKTLPTQIIKWKAPGIERRQYY